MYIGQALAIDREAVCPLKANSPEIGRIDKTDSGCVELRDEGVVRTAKLTLIGTDRWKIAGRSFACDKCLPVTIDDDARPVVAARTPDECRIDASCASCVNLSDKCVSVTSTLGADGRGCWWRKREVTPGMPSNIHVVH